MSKFVRVKYNDRYTKEEGNYLWLNLDNIISLDEDNRGLCCIGRDAFYVIDEESMPVLLEALKGSAE